MQKIILPALSVAALSLTLSGCWTMDGYSEPEGMSTRGNSTMVHTKPETTSAAKVESRQEVDEAKNHYKPVKRDRQSVSLVGKKASAHDVAVFNEKGVVYRNGHAYHIRNGIYVLVR